MVTKQMIIEHLENYFGKANNEAFAESAERGQNLDMAKSLGCLVDGFIDNCGVSAGMSTVYFDAGAELYDKFLKTEHPLAKELDGKLFYDAIGMFSTRYTDEFDQYDISLLQISDYLELCKQEMACNRDAMQVEALCYATWLLIDDYFSWH